MEQITSFYKNTQQCIVSNIPGSSLVNDRRTLANNASYRTTNLPSRQTVILLRIHTFSSLAGHL